MRNTNYRENSYDEYKLILKNIAATGRYCDYSAARPGEPFVVLRHDVEFSPERALRLQEIENYMGISSSYFFQITNNTYNTFSTKNMDIVKEIYSNGHHIGLHYHLYRKTDIAEITRDIEKQSCIMSDMLGFPIDRFSFHRPDKFALQAGIEIDGLINTYSPLFITYADEVNAETELDVKYISDSKHMWSYGYPDAETLSKHPKIQVLIHPYSWTVEGYNNADNFRSLIAEKNDELISSIDSGCKHFREVRHEL